MAELQINTAHRNAILDATGAIFNGGTVQVRSGARAGANASAGGSLLASLTVGNPAFDAASNGTMASASNWSGTVVATGAPGHYRLQNAAGTQIREGDAAEAPGSGESMILDGLVDGDLIEGGTLTIEAGDYTISQPEGSADPA